MNQKTLALLAGAAVIALGAAIAINLSNRPQSDAAEQARPLLPQLHGHVNDVSALTFSSADAHVFATLRRGAGGWTVLEKSGYLADLSKLREFLLKLDQATLLEQKTSNPKRYADLGVDDVKDKDAKGVLVDIAGLAKPTRLIIGNYNGGGGGGTFVRVDGEAQSWLAKGNLTVDKNTADWERRELADIASTRLASVTLTSPDGKLLKVYKQQPGDANFTVADVPKGRETSSEFAANGLGSTLAGLKADDVFPASAMEAPEKVYKADYAAFDGLNVSVLGWEKDGKDYVQLGAKLDTAAANAQIDRDQARAKADYEAAVQAANKTVAEEKPGSGTQADANAKAASAIEATKPLALSDPARDRQQKLDVLSKEAADLDKAFKGWTFVLPSFKFSEISKGMDDMLKPLEAKKADATKPAGKAPAKPAGK